MSNIRTWVIGAVALMLVVVIAGYMLGISPLMSQVDAANQQTATIQTTNASSQAQLASLRTQYAGIGKLKANLNTLRGSIPELEEASSFFNELTALSAQYGVTVVNLTLANAVVYTAPGAAAATTPAPSTATQTASPSPSAATTPVTATPVAAGSNLIAVPVGLTVVGPFDATRDFVGALQTGTRLIYVTTTSLTSSDLASSATIAGNLFTLKGTSDVVTKTKLIPTPTATATPTATPTPTPTPTTAKTTTSGGSATGTAPAAPVVPVATPTPTDTPAGP
jgi:Tfp pilus assembly protein PilO